MRKLEKDEGIAYKAKWVSEFTLEKTVSTRMKAGGDQWVATFSIDFENCSFNDVAEMAASRVIIEAQARLRKLDTDIEREQFDCVILMEDVIKARRVADNLAAAKKAVARLTATELEEIKAILAAQ
jgi:hypothetical protein